MHDYVQWIFPTDEASMFNSSAPLLSQELAAICRGDEKIQANFDASVRILFNMCIVVINLFGLKRLEFLILGAFESCCQLLLDRGSDLQAFPLLFGLGDGGEKDH